MGSSFVSSNAGITTQGLWHYPATITNATIATQFASFAPAGSFSTATTAGVINKIGSRQQMVFFISWATDWSITSNYLQHAWIHWITRGLCKSHARRLRWGISGLISRTSRRPSQDVPEHPGGRHAP